jgi:hypothetical protein
MSRVKILALSAALACSAGAAWATSPNGTFLTDQNGESINTSTGALTVTWVEDKISADTDYTYSGTGTFTELCGCSNKAGHCPPGQQTESQPSSVTPAPVTCSAHKKQSKISCSMTFTVSNQCLGISCQGKAIHAVPTSITWTNVVVTDTTTPASPSPTDSFCASGDPNCTASIACLR